MIKNVIIVILWCWFGGASAFAGGTLGLLAPMAIARISKPEATPALSFIPIFTVPVGIVAGLLLGMFGLSFIIRQTKY